MSDQSDPSIVTFETKPRALVEHLYAPYCAGYRIVQYLEKVFGVSVVSYNIIELQETHWPIMPPHIREKYYQIVAGGRVPYGGLFFVNGRYVGTGFRDSVIHELDRLGIPRIGEPPTHSPHPQLLDQNQAKGTLIIRAVTQEDLSGHGNPSPAYCTELQFGDKGNPETVGLLAGWTGRYGCCMLGAYIDHFAAGFVTFAPREEIWKLGWFETIHEPMVRGETEQVLVILCLHVYPGARRRGIATSLVAEVIEYAKDRGYKKIIAYTGLRSMKTIGQSAGNSFPYERNGFTKEVLVPPGKPHSPGDTGSRQYQGLARMTYVVPRRPR